MIRLFTVFILLSTVTLKAQSIKSYSLAPAGSTFSTSSLKGQWLIGSITSGAVSNDNFNMQQGYLRTNHVVEITATEKFIKMDISIFPNPSSDYIQIQRAGVSTQDEFLYSLYDSQGMLMDTGKINSGLGNNKLSITDLHSGIYILSLTDSNAEQSLKFRIIKN